MAALLPITILQTDCVALTSLRKAIVVPSGDQAGKLLELVTYWKSLRSAAQVNISFVKLVLVPL